MHIQKRFLAGTIGLVAVALCASAFLFSGIAFAGTGLGVTPNFPSTIAVGSTSVPVSLDITNNSSADVGSLTLDTIAMTPQCGDLSVLCTSSKDPGVFSVNATGTGSGACTGITFSIAQTDATNGQVSFTPSAPIVLALGATCTVNFSVNALKVPTIDASGAAGVQTAQSAQVTGHDTATGELPATGTGADITTVAKVTPTISTIPSAGGAIGTLVSDTAHISGGTSPSGNVTFSLYPAGDTTCQQTPVFTSTNALSGGFATSSNFATTAAGTYHWIAVYGGDANNNSATSSCADESVTITQAQPSITTTLSSSTGHVGDAVHDSATLTNATANASGSVSYTVYSNNTCTMGAVDAGTVSVTNGTVPNSNPITFNTPGDYFWQAVYSGDISNAAATSTCTDEHLVIATNQPSITTTLSSTTVPVNTAVHDSSTITGATADAGGTVTYNAYAGTSCSGTPVFTNTQTVLNGVVPDSSNFTASTSGTYNFQAVYSGDAKNSGATSACQTEVLTVTQPQGQYCSPGYWKQPQHFDSWVTYLPTQTFSSVFGRTITINWSSKGKPQPTSNPTLLQALQANGGGINLIAREAVDALLNATSLNFGFTTSQVIAAVQQAIDANNPSLLNQFNLTENCPLN